MDIYLFRYIKTNLQEISAPIYQDSLLILRMPWRFDELHFRIHPIKGCRHYLVPDDDEYPDEIEKAYKALFKKNAPLNTHILGNSGSPLHAPSQDKERSNQQNAPAKKL